MLRPNMLSFDDQEGSMVPDGLPPVIDAHVHFSHAVFYQQSGNGLMKMPGISGIK